MKKGIDNLKFDRKIDKCWLIIFWTRIPPFVFTNFGY